MNDMSTDMNMGEHNATLLKKMIDNAYICDREDVYRLDMNVARKQDLEEYSIKYSQVMDRFPFDKSLTLEEFDKRVNAIRNDTINMNIALAKTAAAASGQKLTEEQIEYLKEFYDPMKPQIDYENRMLEARNASIAQSNMYANMTPEQINICQTIHNMNYYSNLVMQLDRADQLTENMMGIMHNNIVTSLRNKHDRFLELPEGYSVEDLTLTDYLEYGGNLLLNTRTFQERWDAKIEMGKSNNLSVYAKDNMSKKFFNKGYVNEQLDDDYVPLDVRMKDEYVFDNKHKLAQQFAMSDNPNEYTVLAPESIAKTLNVLKGDKSVVDIDKSDCYKFGYIPQTQDDGYDELFDEMMMDILPDDAKDGYKELRKLQDLKQRGIDIDRYLAIEEDMHNHDEAYQLSDEFIFKWFMTPIPPIANLAEGPMYYDIKALKESPLSDDFKKKLSKTFMTRNSKISREWRQNNNV